MRTIRYTRFPAAVIIYAAFAVYLYQPYFKHFDKLQYLTIINLCTASAGCYVLSRRWVGAWWASVFAGAIYGFGPLSLTLTAYHPTAGSIAASIPWLFLPAAFHAQTRRQWLSYLVAVFPFVFIILFFNVAAHFGLFPIPVQPKLNLSDLPSLLTPLALASEGQSRLFSFYHVPIAPLVIGLSMLLAARRFGILAILSVGLALGFCCCILHVSPIIWLAIPLLCGAILVGAGMQAVTAAGFADRMWLLGTALVMALLSLLTLKLAFTFNRLFTQATEMYLLGAAVVFILYFMARLKLRLTWLRWLLLCLALAVDMFHGAQFIVDKLF